MTPHFQDAELACHCGCGMLPERDFIEKIEKIRVACGFPIPVTSAARCKTYNAQVSESGSDGPHTTGRAIDLGVHGGLAFMVLKQALLHGITGIGLKQHGPYNKRFVHLDDLPDAPGRPRPSPWSYP